MKLTKPIARVAAAAAGHSLALRRFLPPVCPPRATGGVLAVIVAARPRPTDGRDSWPEVGRASACARRQGGETAPSLPPELEFENLKTSMARVF